MNPILKQSFDFLAHADFSWAFCGGFALELFLGKDLRPHGDIDICAFEADRPRIAAFMQSQGWQVYEFRGQGKVRPLHPGDASEPGRNLMCFLPGCPLVEFFPCEEDGLFYHVFHHTGLKELNYLEFLFNPSQTAGSFIFSEDPPIQLDSAHAFRRTPGGIPYLAPELALLYKALRPSETPAAEDFHTIYPHLTPQQQQWFQRSLQTIFPQGHLWAE